MPVSNRDMTLADRRTKTSARSKVESEIVAFLIEKLGPNVLEMWFENGDSISVSEKAVAVRGPNDFHLNRIRTRFADQLKLAVRAVLGGQAQIEYVLDDVHELESSPADSAGAPNEAATVLTLPTETSARREPTSSQSSSNNRRTARGLETFWFGESNLLAEAGVKQMFDHVGQMSPYVVYGPTGCGKTHLLESIVFDARRKHKLKRCVYLSAEQFTNLFVEALRGSGLPVFRRKYRDLDVLAIDDVQFFAGKNATLAEFQYTVDNMIRNGKQVILASDRPPIDLGRLGSEITARMMSGLVCPLNYPDAEGRAKIVREICRQRGFSIPNEVVNLISQNLARDVRRLSGAINRLHALSNALGREVDVEIARHALTDLFSISRTLTSINKIEKVVCEFCGVKPADLKSSSRQKKISSARMLAMYLSRRHTSNACSEIGDYFGGRSHSTVIAAQQKVSAWIESNQPIDLPRAKYPANDAITRIEADLRIG